MHKWACTSLPARINYSPNPTCTLRSSNSSLLRVPTTKLLTMGDRAFCAAAPRLLNSLPDHLRATQTLDSFKTGLKTFLFRKAFLIHYPYALPCILMHYPASLCSSCPVSLCKCTELCCCCVSSPTFTFSHLADAFIQSDLQGCIHIFFYIYTDGTLHIRSN